MSVRIDTQRVNLWNMIVIAGGIAVNAFIVGGVYVSMNRDIAQISARIDSEASDRKDLLKNYQDSMNNMQKDIAQIQPLSYQATRALEAAAENKKAIETTNDRIDRVVESFGGKLDSVLDNVAKLSTQVQVLGSKLDDMQGKTQHTEFTLPAMRR